MICVSRQKQNFYLILEMLIVLKDFSDVKGQNEAIEYIAVAGLLKNRGKVALVEELKKYEKKVL